MEKGLQFILAIIALGALFISGCISANSRATVAIQVFEEIPDGPAKEPGFGEESHLMKMVEFSKTHAKEGNIPAITIEMNEVSKIISGSASGIVLTHDGYILTNHHVTGTSPKLIEVVTGIGSKAVRHKAKLVAFSEFVEFNTGNGNDLAVIKVDAHFDSIAHLGDEKNRVARHVYGWSFPFGVSMSARGKTFSEGYVAQASTIIPYFGKRPRFTMDILLVNGSSGSGIYGSDHRVIGLMEGLVGFGQWVVGIPVRQIRQFLDENNSLHRAGIISRQGGQFLGEEEIRYSD